MTAALAAHADWSIDPRKRWVAIARSDSRPNDTPVWRLAEPEPVGDVASFLHRLSVKAAGGAVALGLDVPFGVPRAYAAERSEAGFLDFLRRSADWPDFYRVCPTLGDITPERPFYPARSILGMNRASHALALGLPSASALSRLCDRATTERPAGAPVFWTLGANQSGKAAIACWAHLLLPALRDGAAVRLWPFEGAFRALLAPGATAIAETYPAEALRHLGIRVKGSKRRQTDRAAVGHALLAAMAVVGAIPEPAMARAAADGFGADAAGEDRFDCTLGILCVLNVLAGNRPDTTPADPWLTSWEGWVLGQTTLPAKA